MWSQHVTDPHPSRRSNADHHRPEHPDQRWERQRAGLETLGPCLVLNEQVQHFHDADDDSLITEETQSHRWLVNSFTFSPQHKTRTSVDEEHAVKGT